MSKRLDSKVSVVISAGPVGDGWSCGIANVTLFASYITGVSMPAEGSLSCRAA